MAWEFSVLVVANVTGRSPELLEALRERASSGACRFTLIVPATGGGSAGREAAQERLDRAVELMGSRELQVEGQVGDPDPVAAVSDVWDPTKFDEVVVSTLPTGSSKWLAIDLPHRIEKLTGVPVRHVVAQPPKPAPQAEHIEREERRYGVLTPLIAAFAGRRGRDRPAA